MLLEYCGSSVEDIDVLVEVLMKKTTKAVLISYPTDYCDLIYKLVAFKKSHLVTWECPSVSITIPFFSILMLVLISNFRTNFQGLSEIEYSHITSMQPKISTSVSGIVNVLKHLRLRSVSLISLGNK